jgi:hypothetical protein
MSNIFIARSGFPIFPSRLGTEADVQSPDNGVDSPKHLRSNLSCS